MVSTVSVACTILSLTNAALFERYFPNDPEKLALANLLRVAAEAFKVLQSRVIEDEDDRLKCAYRSIFIISCFCINDQLTTSCHKFWIFGKKFTNT